MRIPRRTWIVVIGTIFLITACATLRESSPDVDEFLRAEVEAIFDEESVPDKWKDYTAKNAAYFEKK